MGQTTNSVNGHAHRQDDDRHEDDRHEDDSRSIEQIRADIEETRGELSETIDAIEARLNPQRVKEQLKDKVHDATVGNVQHLAQKARETIEGAAEPIKQKVQDALHRVDGAAHSNATTHSTGTEATSADGMPTNALSALIAPHSPLKPVAEQVVVVFGASSGIGRETALQFARRGARVVVAARGEEGLKSLVESIESTGGQATYKVAEVTDFEQVKAVADHAAQTYGRLDTWVHCAAVSLYATFEETTPEEFRRIVEVNLIGQVNGAKAALPHLRREGRGALIHVSSIEGRCAFPLQSAYSSSKHGVIGFLDSLRIELKKEGVPIFVTNVMPAGINTPFFNKARTKMGVKPMPAPPIYQPSVVAEVILHAAANPTRDIIAGGAGKMFSLIERLSPPLVDSILLQIGFIGQKTKEPKSEEAPDNLGGPLPGHYQTTGDFSAQARGTSLGTWLETHPQAQRAIKGAALGVLLLWAMKRRGD